MNRAAASAGIAGGEINEVGGVKIDGLDPGFRDSFLEKETVLRGEGFGLPALRGAREDLNNFATEGAGRQGGQEPELK